MSALPAFGDLKPPVKAAVFVVAGGGGLAALGGLFANQWPILLVGIASIAVLVLAYKGVLKLLDKRKQAPMLKALAGHSAAAPKGINDPARRARLDDMRKNFEGGVEKFKDAGKNIYSLPWYLLVGEPGSGKTEAIRHCKVGFPPGLQDQLQGVGGTINMNWWFTNHAVILDTAGRLMFEEVEPGGTSEWQEFLKLLKRNRPTCPINGMLLVVPAESLIKDNAEAIERKGGKIAQQLDMIQRALGVRFPVFVIVTKCDLINGFREFFDDLTDPQLQDQILGWSNPGTLDTAFNPELVDQHLATVQQRLVRRRLGLMLDPVNTEDASKRRTEQVDALYAFPESLMKVAPRLRRYLEMIFVAGEWSAKPLFLRGIYFNSSMREGSALDADLAEALGMPVESLPEGRVWERDRAYFLRDLFLSKVFRERGLVTRAINTGQQIRKRKLAVYGAATGSFIVVAVLTVLGWMQLRSRVVGPAEFWAEVGKEYGADLAQVDAYPNPVVGFQAGDYFYSGGERLEGVRPRAGVDEKQLTRAGFPVALKDQAKKKIIVPAIFAPVAIAQGDDLGDLEATKRRQATGVVLEASVVRPLIDYAQQKMNADIEADPAKPWTAEASAALAQLIRLEVGRVRGNKDPKPVELAPLARYVLGPTLFEPAAKDIESLQTVVDWVYLPTGGKRPFPATALGGDYPKLIPGAIARFRDSWKNAAAGKGTDLAVVESIRASIKQLADAEAELLKVNSSGLSDADAVVQWNTRLAPVQAAAGALTAQLKDLRDRRPADKSLAKSYEEALKSYLKAGRDSHASLIAELAGQVVPGKDAVPAAIKPDPKGDHAQWDALVKAHADLTASLDAVEKGAGGGESGKKEIEDFDRLHLRAAAADDASLVRVAMYAEADKIVPKPGAGPEAVPLGALRPRLEKLGQDVEASRAEIRRREAAAKEGKELPKDLQDRMTGAVAVSTFALDKGAQARRGVLINEWIKTLPATPDAFGKAVEGYAQANKSPEPAHPVIPMTFGAAKKFNPVYNPDAAAALLGDCSAVLALVPPSPGEAAAGVSSGPISAENKNKVKTAYDAYSREFLAYWSRGMREHIKVDVTDKSWSAFAGQLAANPQTDSFHRGLNELGSTIEKAMKAVQPVIRPDPARPNDPSPDSILAQIESARKTLADTVSKDNFRNVLQSWRNLSPTASAARRTVLDSGIKFAELYMPARPAVFEAGAPLGDFVTFFWEDLALTALERLALQCQSDGTEALRLLATKRRFPLGRPNPAESQLSQADIAEVGDLVSRVGAQAGSPAGAVVAPAGAPSPGGKPDFNTYLNLLRNPTTLNESDTKWLQAAAAVLAGLPPHKEDSFTCIISYLGNPQTDTQKQAQEIWPDMGIAQGAAVSPAQRVRNEDARKLGEVKYSGDELNLRFFTDASTNQGLQSFKIAGPWSVLRLLHDYANAKPEKLGDAKVWKVNVLVDDPAGGKRSVWLKLEFQKELPDPDQWPR